MPKKYSCLRQRLKERDISREYLAELLGRSVSHVDYIFAGRADWRMQEVYKVADVCGIPLSDIPVFFPPEGEGSALAEADKQTDAARAFANAFVELLRGYGRGGTA